MKKFGGFVVTRSANPNLDLIKVTPFGLE